MVERIRKLCEGRYTTFGALEKKLGFANGSLRKTDEKIQAVRLKTLADYFGVSMEYILTGSKSTIDELSDRERELLSLFRSLTPTGKRAAINVLRGFQSLPEYVKEKNQSIQIEKVDI